MEDSMPSTGTELNNPWRKAEGSFNFVNNVVWLAVITELSAKR
jgi:hypothetical protein